MGDSVSVLNAVPHFCSDPLLDPTPVKPSELEVFSDVKEVTGYVMIQSSHPEFTNLSFLRNLETIRGRDVDTYVNRFCSLLSFVFFFTHSDVLFRIYLM